MKRAGMVLAVCLMLSATLPSFAQQAATTGGQQAAAPAGQQANSNPKSAYYKSIPIIKVWMHQLGYIVQFWTSTSTVSSIYIPLTWFNQGPNSKADIIYGNEKGYPYLGIYWVDGKFDHVNLYVLDNFDSPTWGVSHSTEDLTSQFNVQDVPREF